MPIVALDYIEVDDRGVAKLVGTRVKVRHLVMVQQTEGFTAEQLIEQYPDLQPAQVYAALAYYHAHKAEVDQEIEASVRFAEELEARNPTPLASSDRVRVIEHLPARESD